jgi:DNA-binding NtrC family response regulator
VVDDDEAVRDSLATYLESDGWDVVTAGSGEHALERMREGEADVMITDVRMPGIDGITLIREALDLDPDIEVLVTTGHSNEDLAIDALRAGAFDYFRKPLAGSEISASLQRTRRVRELKLENRRLRALLARMTKVTRHHTFLGRSGAAQTLLSQLEKVAAAAKATVLLTGESGVGKEVAARMIHRLSSSGDAPFVALNCGGVAESLLESELFGHEKGAFTGADKRNAGIFEMASGGTVFLDEISEMSHQAQTRLLRVLEERTVRRLGGTREVSVDDVRVVAATNRDLETCVRDGAFREDLFYRIRVAVIEIPPLRQRREDILPLATFFLESLNKESGRDLRLSEAAERALVNHDFPGNIRDLRNTIERACIFTSSEELMPTDLGLQPVSGDCRPDVVDAALPDDLSLVAHEQRLITAAFRVNPGNHSAAARALGISPQALYRKLEKYKLDVK